jgi:hypothetical protein
MNGEGGWGERKNELVREIEREKKKRREAKVGCESLCEKIYTKNLINSKSFASDAVQYGKTSDLTPPSNRSSSAFVALVNSRTGRWCLIFLVDIPCFACAHKCHFLSKPYSIFNFFTASNHKTIYIGVYYDS